MSSDRLFMVPDPGLFKTVRSSRADSSAACPIAVDHVPCSAVELAFTISSR